MRDGKARVPTPEERARLFAVAAANRHPERNVAILMLSYGLGMRAGEIAAMNVEDVLNEDGTITQSFTLKRKNTKTKKSRELYLSNPKLIRALDAYITHLRSLGTVYLEHPLFKSQRRRRLSSLQMRAVMAVLYKKAGLKDCKSHSGRRTFATKLLQDGTDIRSVQMLMGHSSIKQTGEYADTSPDKLRKAAMDAL